MRIAETGDDNTRTSDYGKNPLTAPQPRLLSSSRSGSVNSHVLLLRLVKFPHLKRLRVAHIPADQPGFGDHDFISYVCIAAEFVPVEGCVVEKSDAPVISEGADRVRACHRPDDNSYQHGFV